MAAANVVARSSSGIVAALIQVEVVGRRSGTKGTLSKSDIETAARVCAMECHEAVLMISLQTKKFR